MVMNTFHAIEDISVNEVTVHRKLIDGKCYEKPYNDITKVFYKNFNQFYEEAFHIFGTNNSNSMLFFNYL
jgi:hypothetical protein